MRALRIVWNATTNTLQQRSKKKGFVMRCFGLASGARFNRFPQCMMLLLYACGCTSFLWGARGDAPSYRRSFFAGSLHLYWCYTSSSFSPNCVVDDVNSQPLREAKRRGVRCPLKPV